MKLRLPIRFVLIFCFQLFSEIAYSQCSLSDYTFTKTTGTFTPISGSTKLPVVVADDATSTVQPIGFEFFYAGRVYNNFYMNSNGYVALVNGVNTASPVAANIRNVNGGNTFGNAPILFPLFGDLTALTTTTPPGDASYILEGTAPNRVLTVQWLNWKWGWSATAPSVSFQAKIYEGSNKIEYVYKPGSVAPNLPVSIGMAAPDAANAASYLSVNGLSTSATVSGSTFTTNIQPASVVDGLTYTFTPPAHAVTITQQPPAGAVFNSGDSPITITTVATASSALSYQWQQSADNGVSWTNVSNNAPFSNATTASLTITNPASTLHKYLYRCQITAASSTCPNYTSIFTLGIYQGYTVINDLGGVAQSPLNDLRISIGAGGQIQVKRNSQNQVFDPAYANAATTPLTRLFNGVFLTIGTTVFGPANTPANNATTVTPFVTVSHTGGSMTGDGRDVLVLKATKASKDYLITLTYDYVYPNSYFNIQYKVDVPAGNTERIKIYHLIDTYLQGGDAGPAYIQGRPPYILMGVTKSPSFEAFRYVSGLVWTGYYSSDYSGMYSSYLKTQTNFDNILNYTATTDNGIGWMYDFGASTAAGSYDFSSDLVFELPPLPTITTQPSNQVGCANSPVTFTTATSTPNALYQWQVSTNGGTTYTDLADNGTYSGTTAASLVVLPTSAMSTYKYRCIIYTAPGWNASYTNAATLTINPVTTAGTPTLFLSTTNYCVNNTYDLSVTNPVLGMSYIWKKDGNVLTGVSSATYSTTQIGTYTVQFAPSGYCPGNAGTITVTANVSCLDADSDGVTDEIDLDDDNDGVLDRAECNMSPGRILFAGSSEDYSTMRSSLYAEFNNNKAAGSTIVQSNIIQTATVPAGFYDGYDMVVFGGAAFETIHANHWAALKTAIQNKTSKAFIIEADNCCVTANQNGLMNLLNGVFGTNYALSANHPGGTESYTLNTNSSYASVFSTNTISGANYFPIANVANSDVLFYSASYPTLALAGMKQIPGTASKNQFVAWFVDGTITQGAPWYTDNQNKIAQGFYDAYSATAPLTCDTDNDGIYNHQDLDSDGDSCPDAKEAGSASSTTSVSGVVASPYGANGFADGLETSPGSGLFIGNYSYNYAISNSINACVDADSDGIGDLIDIDDDNDGITDITEQLCTTVNALTDLYGPDYWRSISWTGGAYLAQYSTATPDIYIDGNLTNGVEVFRPGTTASPIAGDDFTATPIVFTMIPKNPLHADGFSIVNDFGASGDNILKADIKLFSGTGSNTILLGTETVDNMADVSSTTRYPFSKGYDNITSIKIYVYKTQPAGTQAANGMQMGELGLYSNTGTFCANIDTDGDGIYNQFDLDSDGDGCSDALEAGTTNSTTANYIFSGPYGINGLANSLETVADNGIFNGSYTYVYATTSAIATCTDSDSDGVRDMVDIDDDNDGILDAVESPSCFYTSSEWLSGSRSSITATTSLAMHATYNNLELLVDGENGTAASNYAVLFNASTTAAQTVYSFKMPVPVELKRIYLGYINTNTHFNANTLLRLEGSNDNLSWRALSANTYGVVTSVPGVSGTINANTFTVTQNSGKYLYYRIYWVSGGGVNASGYSNEVYFETLSTYQASANPKTTCSNDTDADGIVNHLDLDSDGDGCPDAKETGVTGTLNAGIIVNKVGNVTTTTPNVPNTIAAGGYGVNGFADALETVTDNGIYSGTYMYNYANSAAVSLCMDSDNDGVIDINDLDDDNDGVLDVTECPPFDINNLSYSPAAFTVTNGASASQTFPVAPDGLVVNVWTLDNSFNVRINGTHLTNPEELQFWTGAPSDALFEFLDGTTYSAVWGIVGNQAKPLIRIYIDKVGRLKVYGSRTSGGALEEMRLRNGSFNRITLNTNASNTFQIGQAVVAQTFISGDYGVITPPSCDDDNDGIANGLDLDSDGDGCPDAKEAGVNGTLLSGDVKNGANGAVTSTTNLPNAIAGSAGNYGANGLANVVETSSESGVISYTSTYTNFARSSTLNVCLDTDNDGVADVLDIDDDNDGILDNIEQIGCYDTGLNLSSLTFSGTAVTGKTANTITSSNTNAWISSYSNESFGLPISFKFKRPTVGNIAMLGLLPVYGTQTPTTYATNSYKFYFTSTTVQVPFGTSYNVSQTASAEDEYSVDISSTGYITMKINGIQKAAFQGVNSSYKVAVSGLTTTVFTDIRLSNPSNPLVTTCTDTDNDGIPNYLDLDSDGDGCSDALEAASSTTASSTSIFPTGTDTNGNGLLNNYEGNTAGTINYVSYYADYALVNTINTCLDTDSDGVKDLIDLDDDNDGVLDATEMSCASTLMSYSGVTISKPNTINYTFNGSLTIDNLIDGIDNNNYVLRAPTGTLNGEWFRISSTTLKVLNYVEIGHYNTQTLFTVGSTYKVEGSLDGVNWTNLSGTLTYNNDTKSVLNGRYSNYNSNAASFNNTNGYFFYRLVGINATSGGTWATELYFKQKICTDLDTDANGTPNRLDLDSDGDGCSDALESGTTTSTSANYVYTSAMGNNGFANSLETSTESGVYSGTYTYNNFALNNTINACLDFDNDGVRDVLDLDDDNDGVLDVLEQKDCLTDVAQLTFNGTPVTNITSNTLNAVGTSGWKSSYSNQTLSLPISLSFKLGAAEDIAMFGLISVDKTQTPANWNDGGYKFYLTSGSMYGNFTYQTTGGWDFTQTASTNDIYTVDISETGYLTAKVNGVIKKQFQGLISDYRVVVSSNNTYTVPFIDIVLKDPTVNLKKLSCTDIDTDNDGTSNRFDLDSDGDGCSDAVESGTSLVSTSGVNSSSRLTAISIPAPWGLNGFADGLETTAESGIYTSVYTYANATNATIKSCVDTDNDGVMNMVDIDDDNDGILDFDEDYPLCKDATTINWVTWSVIQPSIALGTITIGSQVINVVAKHSAGGMTQTGNINNGANFPVSYGLTVNKNTLASQNIGTITVSFSQPVGAPAIAYASLGNSNLGVPVTTSIPYKTEWSGMNTVYNSSNQFTGRDGYNIVSLNGTTSNFTLEHTVFENYYNLIFGLKDFSKCSSSPLDTDRDGIPNSQDLDSDGDGCSDASESKTVSSLTATTVSGAYGNNGFADSIETATESGVYSGTYFYSRAIDPTIKACLDSDYDGVPDLDDVDDDNDGILDANECPTAALNTNESNGTFGTAAAPRNVSNTTISGGYVYSGSNTGAGQYAIINQSTAYHSSASFWRYVGHTTGVANDAYLAVNGSTTVGIFYSETVNLQATVKYRISFWHQAASAANDYALAAELVNGSNTVLATASTGAQNSLGWKLTTIDYTSPTNQAVTFRIKNTSVNASGNDFSIDDISITPVGCPDTDGDGIPNQLDLDSDGDGCSDANEAYGLTTAQGTDGNQYFGNSPLTVDATGKVSGATYTATSVNVLTAGSASTITAQPTNQSINVGGTAVFSTVLTAGSGTTSYQWQVSADGGTTWTNVTNSSMYTGAGTTTLTVSNVPLSMKGFRYRLNVAQSNYVCGNITSSVARLSMDNTPIVVDDILSVSEDTPVSGNVLTNDKGSGIPAAGITVTNFIINGTTYTAGQTASISGVGSITINTDGTYTFTATANYNGTLPLIEYTATDANGGTDVGALNITVTPVNDAPVAVDDIKTTNENTTASGNVLTDGTDDFDVDGNSLTITQFTINGVTYNPGDVANIPGKGSITMNVNGSYTFTPTAGYSGAVPDLDYTLSDGNGGSDVGRLTITINSVNDAPLATDDIVTINQNTTATGNLLTNDADVDAGSTLTVTTFSFTINGTTYTNTTGATLVTMPGIGTIQISANGAYSFVPTGTYTGTVPPISYTLSDGSLTDIGLLDIFVAPVNFNPVANADTQTSAEDTPATGNVLTNDTDANNNTLTVTQYSFTVSGVTYTYPAGSTNVVPGAGTFVVNANGTYVFTPFPNYNGSVPAITYVISDANGGTATSTVSITITNVNDAPIAVNDDNLTTLEDTALSGNVLSNDSDPDGNAITVSQFVVNGTSYSAGTTATIAGVGTLLINSNGTFTFTPLANYNGPVPTITYTAVDASGGTDTATLNIAVTPVNDAPVVVNETPTTLENTPLSGNVLSNDTDVESNTLTITQFTIAGVGTATAATYPAGSIVDIPNVGTLIVNADGTFTFTPVRGYFGTPPVITYAVSDGNGGVTNGTLAITVTPVNDPPVVAPESRQIQEDAAATGNLLTNDTDPENNSLSITQFTIAGISGTFTSTASIPGVGTITINADGTYTFTPTTNYNGIVPAIEYTVSDGLGGTTNGNLTIVVASVNDAPIVANETKSAPVNTAISDNVLTNDRDVEASTLSLTKFTIAGVDYTAGTTATITGVGTIVMNADGTFTFTPATNYVGSAPVITYTVSDGTATSTGTLSLTITPIDADGDGIPDEIEKGPGSTPRDTDTDGIPDYLDTDSDGDGILDNAEDAICVGFMPCTPTDTDGDGTPDYRDLDSDGDGIPDATEGTTDTDGDGVPNYRDTDSDGDGILDSVEGTTDTDGDGVPNYKDLDSDGDGIPDATEGTTDTDGDGIPNYKDLDSDGDGISDAIEGTTDTDGDGTPNYRDTDSDGDGISDAIEKGPNATPVDTDGDGTPDYKDLDSDNDGILDSAETATDTDGDGVPNFRDLDSDGDGILDAVEGTVDTDGDGTPNFLDTDSDGDGIPDSIEKGPGSVPVDTDGDGTPDYKDLDTDGDGIPDAVEDAGCTGTAPCTPTDTDGDGIPNFRDLDSDGDGISDAIEKGPNGATPVDTDSDGTPDYLDLDSDGDGISDAIEKGPNATPIDTDGDGIPDFRDTDSDNDGISDAIEKGPTSTPVDTDGDGVPDYRDLDSDGDGKSDQSEGNVDTDNDGTPNFRDLDSDGDGVLDAVDVCPLISGLGSANGCPPDSDGDGLADAVDSDDDNDGILDTVEAAACSPSAVDCDTDGDGIPNRLDADSDGDGISDVVEAGGTDADNNGIADGNVDSNGVPSSASGGVTPTNTDGTGNSNPYDTDSDGDGISDAIEKGTGATLADTDNDNIPDYLDTDSDGDGISDAIEKGTGAAVADTDNDGIPDFRDLDSDGDGIPDATEGTTDSDNDGIPNFRDVDSDGDGILDSIEDAGCTGITPCTPTNSDNDNIPDYLDQDSDNDGIPDVIEGTVDTDGDGTPDYLDTDSDGDGILDSVEDAGCTGTAPCTPTDTDGDGIPNFRDLDSDGDGITDAIEGTTDTDGDSKPNYLDTDSDGDGISDLIEGNVDTDGDGTPNYLDLDSDGDGIPDSIEKGVATSPADTDGDGTPDYLDTDTDGDGIPDSVEDAGCTGTAPCTPTDTDGDGIPNFKDLDSDGDGIPDSVEKGANGATPDNTDGATVPDYLDTDSDNDGILDAVERGIDGNNPLDTDGDGIPDYKEVDSDNDGIPDAVEGTVDTDGDGIPDYRDTDSDNDGILDSVEKGGGSTPVDTDNDGTPDYKDLDSDADNKPDQSEGVADYDGDGIPNYLDPDSDGDGINDITDQCPLLPGIIGNNGCPLDTDGDGVYDTLDADDDNDGIIDTAEAAACSPAAPDCDTDGDGIPNRLDPDSDNDGISDVIESNGTDVDGDGKVDGSVDADGVPSSTNGGLTPPNTDGTTLPDPYDLDSDGDGIKDSLEGTVDTDGDGIPNYRDLDSDGDGIPDSVEKGTGTAILDTDGDGTPDYKDLDSDGDGIPDSVEKGPNGATPLDTDGDGIPNYRDLDSDGDGIPDNIEGTTDTDGDGIPNYLDTDSDGDGITDAVEKGLNGNSPIDTDGDGIPDYKDLDSDNDGIPDSVEGTTDTDGDGVPNYRDLDSDGDGITDAVEKGANGATPIDTDRDGIPDYKDTDSDGDGKLDAIEKGTGAILLDTDRDGIPDYRDVDNYGISDFNVTNVRVPVSGSVKTNDTVPTGSSYGQPAALAGATLVIDAATGTYTFTSNIPGKYVYYVPVCGPSQTSNCPQTPLEITVLDPLAVDKPAANNDFAILEQGGSATVAILVNDRAGNVGKSIDASTLVVTTAPVHGTAVVNSDGTISYTPSPFYVGVDSLVYRVCDTNVPSQCQSATAYFTVEPAGLLVKTGAVDDFSILRSSPDGSAGVTGNVVSNDLNGAGATLTANLLSGPSSAQGTFTMNAAGNYTFTPTAGFSGPVDIVYEACGGSPVVCTKATLHILVEPLPALVNDIASAFANVPKTGDISANDAVPAGTTYGQPAALTGATITVAANGTYTFTATATGTYTYTIPVCAPGQIGTCPTETLVITVTAPGPVDDTTTAFANVPKSGNIATNDSNPAGTTFGQPTQETGATITVAANGTYTFTATAAGTYTYTIPVCAPGQTSNCPTETLVITVTAPGPVNDTASTAKNTAITGNVATNDSNPAGTTFGQPAAMSGATITVNADGTYSFTATAAGTYTYTIPVCAPGQTSNCPTETLVITVTEPSVPPTPPVVPPVPQPVNDTASTTKNTAITGNVATNDNNPAGTTFGQPAAISGATITVNPDGTYSFTATAAGTYTYTIPVCAPGQTSNCPTETLAITVTDPTVPYTAPTTNPDIDATNINVPVSGNVSTNDAPGATYGQPTQQSGATITVNANGTYSFTATIAGDYTYLVPACPTGQTTNCPTVPLVITVSDPLKDSNSPVANTDVATLNAGSSVTTKVLANDKAANPAASLNPASLAIVTNGANGTAVVNADGTITYTPKAGFTGVDEITYKICDNSTPALCATAKVSYTVQPVAEPAKTFATDDYNSSPAGTPVTGSVLTNDKNTAGETLTATIISGVSAAEGTLVFNSDGTYVFTPAPGFSGPVDVVYTVCSVSNVCAKATLHLVVNPPEILTPDFNATLIGIPVNGSAATNDVVPAGSTYGQPASISGATIRMNPDGTYSFTSTTPGTYEYLVPVCAKAQTTNCPLIPLVITVSDPNAITNPPIANSDVVSVAAGSPVTTNVLANDQAANVGGVLVYSTLAITTSPANGTAKVNADGTITYTPKPGFVGTDVLTYTVCDNSQPALCKTAKVYYTVGATASKNLLASDDFATTQGGIVSGNVLGNDKSSTGSALTATAVTNVDPAKGSFSLSPSGAYTFTPATGYVGPVDIVYSVCSADGKCTQATLHITVLPVPDMIAPQAITPNGDGKNDTLIFRGLPGLNIENRLTIYNRWGNIVFSTGNYQNNWSGQTDSAFGALSTDNQLPDATYYYILDFFGARPNLGNYVYLDRSSN